MAEDKQTRGPGLVVRLTPDERDQWHAAARAAGFAQTARWVRQVVADHVSGAAGHRRGDGRVVSREVLAHLGKIGSNMNQLAHRANSAALSSGGFGVELAELEAIRRELVQVRTALQELSKPVPKVAEQLAAQAQELSAEFERQKLAWTVRVCKDFEDRISAVARWMDRALTQHEQAGNRTGADGLLEQAVESEQKRIFEELNRAIDAAAAGGVDVDQVIARWQQQKRAEHRQRLERLRVRNEGRASS